jgi:fumarate reductase subunit C
MRLMLVHAFGQGDAAYQDFRDRASWSWLVALNVVALLFLVLRAVT